MTARFTPEALERPLRTVQAAELLMSEAATIANACAVILDSEIVVAVIRPDLTEAEVYAIPLSELREYVSGLEEGSWSLTFAPSTSLGQIEERCMSMARAAMTRGEAMRRYMRDRRQS